MTRRYSRWDGTQNPFEPIEIDDVITRFSEDLLDGWSAESSLRRILRDGIPGRFSGLDELRDRLNALRQRAEEQAGAESPFGDVRQRLEEILDLERHALDGATSPEAPFKRASLDALPDNPARMIRELRNHTFESDTAAARFEELMEEIRRAALDAQFRHLSESISNPSAADMDRLKDMLADLNTMLDQYRDGAGPSQEQFDEFMKRHGDFFPEQPNTIEELLDALAQRAAAFSRFMGSLSPEQRAELDELMSAVLDDLDLQFEMSRLGDSLRALAPQLDWDRPVQGDQTGEGLGQALAAIEELSALEDLDRQLGQQYAGADLADVDEEELTRRLGPEAGRDLARLRSIERALEQAGLVAKSHGRLELTPRGVRKLGERALARVFERIAFDRPGSHDHPVSGGSGDRTGLHRPWRFGDPFRLNLQRSIHNAVVRSGPSLEGVKLAPEDFEIEEHEYRTSVATVLLLDMSRSMPLRGHWLPAKRMALALHALITTAYPEDSLTIVAFSDYARIMRPEDLGDVDWEPVYGTNMEHAFSLAGRILSKHRDADKQVLLVTDGEPTAHLVGEHVFFQWPPARETLEKTYREAMRLARSGATMNIFMLEREPGLVAFIDKLAQIVHGRVFSTRGDELGDMIVRDYLR